MSFRKNANWRSIKREVSVSFSEGDVQRFKKHLGFTGQRSTLLVMNRSGKKFVAALAVLEPNYSGKSLCINQ